MMPLSVAAHSEEDEAMMLVMLGWLLGCSTSKIMQQYEQEKLAVMNRAPAAQGDNWRGDIRMRLQPESLDKLSDDVLDAGLLAWKKPIEVKALGVTLKVVPRAEIRDLDLTAGKNCDDCLSFNAQVKGQARWKAGPLDGQVPFSARVAGDMALSLVSKGEKFALRGKLSGLDKLTLNGVLAKGIDVSNPLKKWTREALNQTQMFPITEFGGDGLPLRSARLKVTNGDIVIEALSDVPGRMPVDDFSGKIPSGVD